MTKTKKLLEIISITSGMAFKSEDSSKNGSIPVISSSKLLSDSTLNDFSDFLKIDSLPSRSPAIINNNDLLIASRATPGADFKASLIKTLKPIVASSSVYILKIKSDLILPEFLNFHLNSSAFQKTLAKKAKGSTIFHITKKVLEDISIPVPKLKDQKLIISLKNNTNKQIAIHKRQQELKEEAMEAIFNNLYNYGNNYEQNNSTRA